MDFQLFDLLNKYFFFDNLIQAINTFVFTQSYAVVKKKIQGSKKGILRKKF